MGIPTAIALQPPREAYNSVGTESWTIRPVFSAATGSSVNVTRTRVFTSDPGQNRRG
jgi:hypothetical protein